MRNNKWISSIEYAWFYLPWPDLITAAIMERRRLNSVSIPFTFDWRLTSFWLLDSYGRGHAKTHKRGIHKHLRLRCCAQPDYCPTALQSWLQGHLTHQFSRPLCRSHSTAKALSKANVLSTHSILSTRATDNEHNQYECPLGHCFLQQKAALY